MSNLLVRRTGRTRVPGSASGADRAGTAARLALAVFVGFAAGALTEGLVLRVPFSLAPLTNSAAPWVLVAFAVTLTARDLREAVVLSIVTFLLLVLGFYVAQTTRGWAISRHQVAFWFAACLVAGPLVGIAAGSLRHGPRPAATIGAGVIGGILVGEAVHGLRDLKFSSPPTYWNLQIAVGALLWVALSLWASRRHLRESIPTFAVSLAVAAATALLSYLAYLLP